MTEHLIRSSIILMMSFAMVSAAAHNHNGRYENDKNIDRGTLDYVDAEAKEYMRHIHSLFDTYTQELSEGGYSGGRGGGGGQRLVIETNSLIDTRFKERKRNADIINSLLALPKGMNDAGR